MACFTRLKRSNPVFTNKECTRMAELRNAHMATEYYSDVAEPESVIIEKHSCWICQEEMSSEALLLQHYEHHMTYVKVKMRFSSK